MFLGHPKCWNFSSVCSLLIFLYAQSLSMSDFCDPMDCSPLGSSVCGIFQARTLEWVGIPFCRGSSCLRGRTFVSCIGRQILYHWAIWEAHILSGGGLVAKLCPTLATPWTVAHWIPLSMGFSRQEHWSRLLFPPPGELNPHLLHWQMDSLPLSHLRSPFKEVKVILCD